MLSAAPGQSKGKERESCLLVLNSVTSTPQWIRQPKPRDQKKHHDTIRDMMAASSHVFSSISRGGTQRAYGGRLFVVSGRTNKRHHHHVLDSSSNELFFWSAREVPPSKRQRELGSLP